MLTGIGDAVSTVKLWQMLCRIPARQDPPREGQRHQPTRRRTAPLLGPDRPPAALDARTS